MDRSGEPLTRADRQPAAAGPISHFIHSQNGRCKIGFWPVLQIEKQDGLLAKKATIRRC
jgi:hypothetical protein